MPGEISRECQEGVTSEPGLISNKAAICRGLTGVRDSVKARTPTWDKTEGVRGVKTGALSLKWGARLNLTSGIRHDPGW